MAKLSDIRAGNPTPTAIGSVLFFGEAADGTPLAFTLDELKAYIENAAAPASMMTTMTMTDDTVGYVSRENTPGKISFELGNGQYVSSQYHALSNSEFAVPENGKTVNVTAKATLSHDSTLSLIKNGDYSNPVATVSPVPTVHPENSGVTLYICDLTVNGLAVAGGDLLNLSVNMADPSEERNLRVYKDPSHTFFTVEVAEVLA